jgi:hypothetical protein
MDRPNRDGVAFVRKDAAVISNRAKWFKGALDSPVQLVGISDFGYTSYKYLAAQTGPPLNRVVGCVVKAKGLEGFFLPGNTGNQAASPVCFSDGVKQSLGLLFGRQELYFQREFHQSNLLNILVNKILKTNGRSYSFPKGIILGFPASII